jgi:hypothetical protein
MRWGTAQLAVWYSGCKMPVEFNAQLAEKLDLKRGIDFWRQGQASAGEGQRFD